MATPWPKEAEEDWRYSGIDRFEPDRFAPVLGEADGRVVAAALEAARAWADRVGPSAILVVTLDGRVLAVEGATRAEDEGWRGEGPVAGVQVRAAHRASGPMARAADVRDTPAPDAFALLHQAFCPDPLLVGVGEGQEVAGTVVVVHLVREEPLEGRGRAVFPELRVELDAGSRLALVEVLAGLPGEQPRTGEPGVPGPASTPDEDHQVAAWMGEPGDPLVVLASGWRVGAGAELAYGGIQALGPRSTAVVFQGSAVERDGRLRSLTAAAGAGWARVRTDAAVVGQGGRSELLAGFLGEDRQVLDFRTFQDHAAPFGESELLFKGAVTDRARSVYSGLIRVRRGARGTNAFQTNHNLVLAEGARADSVPNLDIEENDVRCSHASTVGPIDEEQRYYLACRGIQPAVADRLVVRGFFGDLVGRSPLGAVGAWLDRTVMERLGRPVPAEER